MSYEICLLSDDSEGYCSDLKGLSPEYNSSVGPFIEILEQPGDFRYRYEKERYHGHILSINSPVSKKKDVCIFPKIKVHNCDDDVIVRCWLISANFNGGKPQAHFHKLARKLPKSEMKLEPHEFHATHRNNFEVTFDYLHIVHSVMSDPNDLKIYLDKKKWLESELFQPPKFIEVLDDSKDAYKGIDKNLSVLYIEAFDASTREKLCDVVSRKIKNLHNPETAILKIVNYSKTFGSCRGGDEIFMFVEKISKDVEVRFFEVDKNSQKTIWQDKAEFGPQHVHHQYGIIFRTPKYRNPRLTKDVEVCIELHRKTDGARSAPVRYTYKPDEHTRPDYPLKRPYTPETNNCVLNNEFLDPGNTVSKKSRDMFNMSPDSTIPAEIMIAPSYADQDSEIEALIKSSSNSEFSTDIIVDSLLLEHNIENSDFMPDWSTIGPVFADEFIETDSVKPSTPEKGTQWQGPLTRTLNKISSVSDDLIPQVPLTEDKIRKENVRIENLFRKISKDKLIEHRYYGDSLIMIASQHSTEALKYMLKCAKIDKTNKNLAGDDALLCAVRSNSLQAVTILLENGFDPNEPNYKSGETALHIAITNENLEIVNTLLKHGANPLMDNYASLSPYDYSVYCSNCQIRNIIFQKVQQIGLNKKSVENDFENEIAAGLETLKVNG